MKIRIRDRLLVSLSGLILFLGGIGLAVQKLGWVDIIGWAERFIMWKSLSRLIVCIVVAVILVLLGLFDIGMLFRRKNRSGFVVQKTESGELSISIKALEALVEKCVDKHSELHVVSIRLENRRDGLVIRLRIALANGINIPLVVNSLQKQIKQYVTACSGVDVSEVCVQVDTSADAVKTPAYIVPETESVSASSMPETPVAEKEETIERPSIFRKGLFNHREPEIPAEQPVEVKPAETAAVANLSVAPVEEEVTETINTMEPTIPMEDGTSEMIKESEVEAHE